MGYSFYLYIFFGETKLIYMTEYLCKEYLSTKFNDMETIIVLWDTHILNKVGYLLGGWGIF